MLDDHTLMEGEQQKDGSGVGNPQQIEVMAVTQRTGRGRLPKESVSPNLCPFSGPQICPQAGPQTVCGPSWGGKKKDHFSATLLGTTTMGTRGIPSSCATKNQRLPTTACGSEFRGHTRAQHRWGYTNPPPRRRVKGRARRPTAVQDSSVTS